jgi:hypothetical protein
MKFDASFGKLGIRFINFGAGTVERIQEVMLLLSVIVMTA